MNPLPMILAVEVELPTRASDPGRMNEEVTMNRIPPDADGFLPVCHREPTDPPFAAPRAKKPHSDEEFDFRRDEELLAELEEGYPWC